MGSQSKRKKGTKDNRSIVNDIKRETDQDANRTALQPTFEGLAYSPIGISQTDYVDVTDTIDPLQTNAPQPPAQVTGLDVLTGSNNNSLNLVWTASPSPGVTYYNIYRSTTSGAEVLVNSTSNTSFIDTGLQGATRYYYKISAVNSAGEGILSVEDSVVTTGSLPAQITGLSVTVIGDTQLNLTWTASGAAGLLYYNIYRSLTTGTEVLVDTSFTNSYNDLTVNPGTTYYYKVAAVNDIGIGTLSSEASGTTTGSAPTITPTVLYHFDNNLLDSSGNSNATGSTIPAGFTTASKFGTHAILCNTTGTPPNTYLRPSIDAPLDMNITVGFSVSLWIYPTDISALDERRVIVEQRKDASNQWTLQLQSDGTLYFFVKKAGVDYKRQKGTFVINSWQHIGATFNAVTNAIEVYKDGVAGASSTQTPQYATDTNSTMTFSFRWNESLNHYYEGRYDEFQFFNGVVLNSTQITNLKNNNFA